MKAKKPPPWATPLAVFAAVEGAAILALLHCCFLMMDRIDFLAILEREQRQTIEYLMHKP